MVIDASNCGTIQIAQLYHMFKLVFANYLNLFAFFRLLSVVWIDKLDLFLKFSVSCHIEFNLANDEKCSDTYC